MMRDDASTGEPFVYEGPRVAPIPLDLTLRKIRLGDEVFDQAQADVYLDRNLHVRVKGSLGSGPFVSDALSRDVFITFGRHTEVEFLLTKFNFFSPPTSAGNFQCVPTRTPVQLGSGRLTEAQFLLSNGPKLWVKSSGLDFSCGNLEVCLSDVPKEADGDYEAGLSHEITHSGISRVNSTGIPFSADDFLVDVGQLVSFLGFVKGTRVGLGQVEPSQPVQGDGFSLVGFSKSDHRRSPTNWFWSSLTNDLPALFNLYVRAMEPATAKRNLGRAFHYYKAGNYIQSEVTETALLMSTAGLETFAYHVLLTQAGWSKGSMRKTNLAVKLRECATFLNLTAMPLEHSPALQRRSQVDDVDDFNLLARFRNGLTHPGDFKYDGRELMEAWLASQWLLEVMLLIFLGYRGQYQDRRRQAGSWAGTLYDLPVG